MNLAKYDWKIYFDKLLFRYCLKVLPVHDCSAEIPVYTKHTNSASQQNLVHLFPCRISLHDIQVNVLQNCSSWIFSCSSFAIWVVMQKICVKWMEYNKQWKSSMNFKFACCYVCISIKTIVISISLKWYHNVFQNSSIYSIFYQLDYNLGIFRKQ